MLITSLGILDVTPLFQAGARAAILGTIDLCQAADQAGYARYWLAQHYTADAAHSSPDVLCGILAGLTTRVRVGPAGMLLRYDGPLRIAGAFRLLETLFPGRIDLGVARGAVDEPTRLALGVEREPDAQAFAERFGNLCRFARTEVLAEGDPVVIPRGRATPQIWALGSATTSAQLAAAHGTAFCQALFLPEQRFDPSILRRYRDEFKPAKSGATPLWNLAVAGVCDEDEARARRALAEHPASGIVATIVGTGEQCADQLDELAHRFDVQEIVFMDVRRGVEDRRRAYELLAASVLGEPAARGRSDDGGAEVRDEM